MRVFVNSRGFEQDKDYIWVEFKMDNSTKRSRSFWEINPISSLPTFDEQTLSMGLFDNGEQFLLITDLETSRTDSKARKIRNSILFLSHIDEDLRKIAIGFLRNREQFAESFDKVILESQSEFGYESEYIQIREVVNSYRDINIDIYKRPNQNLRFGKLFFRESEEVDQVVEVEGEDGEIEEKIEKVKIEKLRLNEPLYSEVERSIREDSFDGHQIFLLYSPFISKSELLLLKPALSIAEDYSFELSKEVEKDTETLHEIEVLEPIYKRVYSSLIDFRYEIASVVLLFAVLIPLSISYLHLNSKIQTLITDSQLLKAQNIKLSKINTVIKRKYLEIKSENDSLKEKLKERG